MSTTAPTGDPPGPVPVPQWMLDHLLPLRPYPLESFSATPSAEGAGISISITIAPDALDSEVIAAATDLLLTLDRRSRELGGSGFRITKD